MATGSTVPPATTILVIHDKKRTDRYNTLIQELRSQNIDPDDVIWIPAVHHAKPMTGISRAHRSCIETAKQLGLDQVTILEDDILFTSPYSFRRYLDLFRDLPDDWDIFFAGAYSLIGKRRVSDKFVTANDIAGLQCYTVRARYYDTFLTAPDDYHVDRWLIPKGRAKAYVAYPMLAMQHDGYSDQQRRMLTLSGMHKNFDLFQNQSYP